MKSLEPLEANAKGEQCDLEQHCGVWTWLSAVVWNLTQLYPESGVLHPFGSFDKLLGIPDAKWGIFPRSLWVVHGCSSWHP